LYYAYYSPNGDRSEFMKVKLFSSAILLFSYCTISSQIISRPIVALSPAELERSKVIPSAINNPNQKIMACVAAANDNYANAQSLAVNGGSVAGTTCGTFQAGEAAGCNTAGDPTVWYSFVATASTIYVKIDNTGGNCFFGSAIYGGNTLPVSSCGDNGPISCQSSSGGPLTQIHQLTNLTIGATYHIQIIYPSGGLCGSSATFNIGVTTANPGGTITNPPPLTTCASPGTGCFFNSPPSVNTVTSTCTSYPLAAAGYSANSIWSTVVQFTSSASWSNFSWQAIITSNCGLGGNVVWLNWTLYDCNCNQLTCGDINALTGSGLACGTCYRLRYQMELANCSSFTTIWPYQNVPSSPTPCTVLPIRLLYFTATPDEAAKKVNVEWLAATEENINNYRISRSEDGINFNLLTIAKANGSQIENIKYNYEDGCCNSFETRYYKLESVENDRTVSYTKIIAVTFKGMKEIAKFAPNPAKDNFVITFGDKNNTQETKLQIFDMFGKLVKEEIFFTSAGYKEFDIAGLNAGIYYINLITATGDDVIKYKLIKQ
jgi:hypothetical protein